MTGRHEARAGAFVHRSPQYSSFQDLSFSLRKCVRTSRHASDEGSTGHSFTVKQSVPGTRSSKVRGLSTSATPITPTCLIWPPRFSLPISGAATTVEGRLTTPPNQLERLFSVPSEARRIKAIDYLQSAQGLLAGMNSKKLYPCEGSLVIGSDL